MTQPTNLAAVELKSFAGMDCSIAQCVEAVGDRWSMLILRDCFLGFTRFDDFQRRLLEHIMQALKQALAAKPPTEERA